MFKRIAFFEIIVSSYVLVEYFSLRFLAFKRIDN